MTDAHNLRVLSDADSAADLAGLPRRPVCDDAHNHMALVTLYSLALMTEGPSGSVDQYKRLDESARKIVSERDALAVRVSELEGDAARHRLLRRGQRWSVIDGIGNVLRGDELDAAIDAALAQQEKTNG